MVYFTFDYNPLGEDYAVYRWIEHKDRKELFCHLSESDLDLFIEMVKKSKGYATISHVLDEDPMGDGSEPKCWP